FRGRQSLGLGRLLGDELGDDVLTTYVHGRVITRRDGYVIIPELGAVPSFPGLETVVAIRIELPGRIGSAGVGGDTGDGPLGDRLALVGDGARDPGHFRPRFPAAQWTHDHHQGGEREKAKPADSAGLGS